MGQAERALRAPCNEVQAIQLRLSRTVLLSLLVLCDGQSWQHGFFHGWDRVTCLVAVTHMFKAWSTLYLLEPGPKVGFRASWAPWASISCRRGLLGLSIEEHGRGFGGLGHLSPRGLPLELLLRAPHLAGCACGHALCLCLHLLQANRGQSAGVSEGWLRKGALSHLSSTLGLAGAVRAGKMAKKVLDGSRGAYVHCHGGARLPPLLWAYRFTEQYAPEADHDDVSARTSLV